MNTNLVSFITSFLVPAITQLLKTRFDLSGRAAYWTHVGVSVALAVAVVVATGQFDVSDVLASVAIIVSTAQTIYHGFAKDE